MRSGFGAGDASIILSVPRRATASLVFVTVGSWVLRQIDHR